MSGRATHFLLVGDVTDLPELRSVVSRLPEDAYGQVFIEATTDAQMRPWRLPSGMTLTWLRRDRVAGRLVPSGELVAGVVEAWVAEWIPEQHRGDALPYLLWIGCSASEQVDRLYRHLADRFDNLHLHHPHN